eukprot:3238273-Rhodomonas_salina.1
MQAHSSIAPTRRAGDVERKYASFLSRDSVAANVLQQSILKMKVARGTYDKWSDRQVTLRGSFVCVGKINHEATSRVYMISSVENSLDCQFTVVCSTQERLNFRAESTELKEAWVARIREALSPLQGLRLKDGRKLTSFPDKLTDSFRSSTTQCDAGKDGPAGPGFLSTSRREFSAANLDVAVPCGPYGISEHTLACGRNTSCRLSTTRARPSVGVFWDTTTVLTQQYGAHEAAKWKVQQYAEQCGNIDLFKVYGDGDDTASAKGLRMRMDKDMLIWLWDQSRRSAETSIVILISDRSFLETTKEMVRRGMQVTVINSCVDKSISVSDTASVEYKRASLNLWQTRQADAESAFSRGKSESSIPSA